MAATRRGHPPRSYQPSAVSCRGITKRSEVALRTYGQPIGRTYFTCFPRVACEKLVKMASFYAFVINTRRVEKMNPSIYDSVEEAARNLYLRALSDIPPDVRQALGQGLEV